MENPNQSGKRKRKRPRNTKNVRNKHTVTTKTSTAKKRRVGRPNNNRIRGAFVFFDINMKKRFVDVFGNVRVASPEITDSGPVNHEFVLIGPKKYVVQVVEWNTENVSRRKLIKLGGRLERHYPRCDFVAWILSDESKQAGITPLAVGTKDGGIMARDVTGPAGLLEVLDWTVDDTVNLILAGKVFQSVHSRGGGDGRTPTDRDILQEMSTNLQSRTRPETAMGAILSRGRNAEASFLGQGRDTNRDIDLAYSLMQAETQMSSSTNNSPPPPLPTIPGPITFNDLITFQGMTTSARPRSGIVSQTFFNVMPGSGRRSLEDLLFLTAAATSSSGGRSSRRSFENTRKAAEKAKKNENINDVSEADLEAFIAMKNQEKVEIKASEPKARSAEDETCLICCDSAIDSVFIPCGHTICCSKCADTQKHVNKDCPICRKTIISVVRLHKK